MIIIREELIGKAQKLNDNFVFLLVIAAAFSFVNIQYPSTT